MKYEELPEEIPLGHSVNLAGQKFNKLTALYRCKNKNTRRTFWACKCDCGEYTVLRSDHLTTGHVKSCGCLNSENLIGKRFGQLTVIGSIPGSREDPKKWICKCDCGEKTTALAQQLKAGKKKSCGKHSAYHDLTRQRFGKLVVLEKTEKRSSSGSIYWKCQCDCGNIIEVISSSLITGNTKSCGCLVSAGEEKIRQLLIKNNIKFTTQKTIKDCINPKTGRAFKFDFYLPDYDLLIEYDGEQHFKYSSSGWNNYSSFKETQERDKAKNDWCQNHNKRLKRIPYTELNNITIDSLLNDQFLI